MWVFRLSGALVFAVFGEGVTRSCHPERGRAPIRFLQDGKPEPKDLGFALPPQGAPPFAVLWRRVGSSLCGADALVRVLRNRSRFPWLLWRRWVYCCAAMSPSRCFAPPVASHVGTTD